jgi:Fic family protein
MDIDKAKKVTQIALPAVVPLLPPKNIDRASIIMELTAAHAAIGELRGFLGTIKNPDLLIAPFRKREAVASSAIEGTRATLDEVMEFEAAEDDERKKEIPVLNQKSLDIIEVVNYERAMAVALRELKVRPIGETLIKKTHATLLAIGRGAAKTPGEFRRAPVAVGNYLPPAHSQIPGLMTNWENYLNSNQLEADPLIRLGVAHYQFEAIHPFMDGNGRIGRLVIPLALCQAGLLETPVLYVSHYLERYKVEYQRLLHAVDTDQEWTAWLKFFLVAVEAQAKITIEMAREIQDLYERLKIDVVGNIQSQHGIAVLDQIFRRPLVRVSSVNRAIKAKSRGTANNLVKKFVAAGVLRPAFKGGREVYYEFSELLKIIRA